MIVIRNNDQPGVIGEIGDSRATRREHRKFRAWALRLASGGRGHSRRDGPNLRRGARGPPQGEGYSGGANRPGLSCYWWCAECELRGRAVTETDELDAFSFDPTHAVVVEDRVPFVDEKHSHGELRMAVRSTRPSSCSSAIPATETRGPRAPDQSAAEPRQPARVRADSVRARRSANRTGCAVVRHTREPLAGGTAGERPALRCQSRLQRGGAERDSMQPLPPSSARSMAATKPTIPPGLWHPTPRHRTSRSYQIRPYLSILGFSDRRLQFCMLSSGAGACVPFECAFEPLCARFDGRTQHITML